MILFGSPTRPGVAGSFSAAAERPSSPTVRIALSSPLTTTSPIHPVQKLCTSAWSTRVIVLGICPAGASLQQDAGQARASERCLVAEGYWSFMASLNRSIGSISWSALSSPTASSTYLMSAPVNTLSGMV